MSGLHILLSSSTGWSRSQPHLFSVHSGWRPLMSARKEHLYKPQCSGTAPVKQSQLPSARWTEGHGLSHSSHHPSSGHASIAWSPTEHIAGGAKFCWADFCTPRCHAPQPNRHSTLPLASSRAEQPSCITKHNTLTPRVNPAPLKAQASSLCTWHVW